MRQFNRKIRVSFFAADGDGITINPNLDSKTDLRIVLNISKSISSEENNSSIQIYNLAIATRQSVGREFDRVIVEAGYAPTKDENNIGVIFKGDIKDVIHKYKDNDIISEITLGDGHKAFRNATISQTFPAGSGAKDIVEACRASMAEYGVDGGETQLPDTPAYRRPYSVCGGSKRELDVLGRTHGFYWSVQNGALEVMPADRALPGTLLLTPKSGLIGEPQITDKGIDIKALLNPEARPNRTIRVESPSLEELGLAGSYRIANVNYSADNREGDFVMDIQAELMQGNEVVGDAQ